jgi:glycosyltransferase involved in cell wall biosynthesis
MSKNVLYIEEGYGFGGAVTCLATSINNLHKTNCNAFVVSSHNDYATRKLIQNAGACFFHIKNYHRREFLNDLISRMGSLGAFFKKVFLVMILFVEKCLQIPFFVKVLYIVKSRKINLICLNNSINVNATGILIARVLRIPCICYIRGAVRDTAEARRLSRYVSNFVVVSKFLERDIIQLGVPTSRINIVYDRVDVKSCHEKAAVLLPDSYEFFEYNIGFFGCLLPWKGQKIFIEAIDILVKDKSMKNCKFFIIGDAPGKSLKYKMFLSGMVEDLELSDYVVFTGHQDNVYSFMNRMDVVIHASVEPEPFGMVIVEAMSLGRPVIATNMGGPLEIIKDGINGFLIEPGNPRILADKIFSVLADKHKLADIGRNAKETIVKKFGIDKHIEDLKQICEGAIK